MKLAVIADDELNGGRLWLVDPPLARAAPARACATLVQAVRDWGALERELDAEYAALASGQTGEARAFEVGACLAPLPSMDVLPPTIAGPRRVNLRAVARCPYLELDATAIVEEVAAGADRLTAAAAIRLVAFAARVAGSREAIYAPVAATPAALAEAWDGDRFNNALRLETEEGVTRWHPIAIDLAQRVAHAAAERTLPAGTAIGLPPAATPRRLADGAALELRDGMGRSLFGPIPLALAAGGANA